MFGAFQTFGKLGAIGKAIAAAWSPLALWPDGAASPGMWIDPSYSASQWQDSAGTTALSTVGTVLDSSNPVGLILDRKGGLVLGVNLVTNGDFSNGTTGWSGANGTLSVVGGKLRITATATGVVSGSQTLSDLTVGRSYRLTGAHGRVSGTATTVLAIYDAGGICAITPGATSEVTDTFVFIARYTSVSVYCRSGNTLDVGDVYEFDNISVREIPGLHLSQSTSAARPVLSALKNIVIAKAVLPFNGSSDMTGAGVIAATCSHSSGINTLTRTTGGASVVRWSKNAAQTLNASVGVGSLITLSCVVRGVGASIGATLSLKSATTNDAGIGTVADTVLTADWTPFVLNRSAKLNDFPEYVYFVLYGDSTSANVPDGASFEVKNLQIELGPTATPYQRVNTASDYTATGFPQYLKFDGVDDELSSATFSAGTLTSSMDCLIAVRRDSTANAVCGLYNAVADATKYFGMAESGSSSGCVGSGAGAPTVWVDGAQLTGGTAVTRGTLHTALTAGAWHILELRGLDLSTWTAAGFGKYTSYILNGARGDIMLFESTASTADKDAARQYLADKYGVTLP